MTKFVFYTLMLTPLMAALAAVPYFFFMTNLPQLLYSSSIRNLPFECMDFVPEYYVYKGKPGPCRLKNIEYDIVFTRDADGFRNSSVVSDQDVTVIGDSFAHGVGVADDQTFAHLLSSEYHYKTRNLGIGSYATMRELETLSQYGKDSKYVAFQYCSNDVGENEASLRLSKEALKDQIETSWKEFIRTYRQGKALGYRKPIQDLMIMLRKGSYSSKASWRESVNARNMQQEASYFARILDRYRSLLEGKRLIIFEASEWALNSPRFEHVFGTELGKLDWLSYRIINTADVLDQSDYFFLDDHTNARGNQKLAAATAGEISRWESVSPIIEHN
jgi:hypothetical protein